MKLTTFDLVIVIGVVAGLAAFLVVSSSRPRSSANENKPVDESPGSAAAVVSLDPNPSPTNASPTYLPGNANQNALNIRPANANTSSPSLTVLEVTAAASTYHGQLVCISGFYQNSFEFTAFGTKRPPNQIAPPYIWTQVEVPTSQLVCEQTQEGERTCTGAITACGIFEYSPKPKFGHVGAYQYQLR
jgi:hypothetical protein